ncbi:ankyrin repeat-containing domain protein [Tuber indicum]|nr:ankyrin repeat-containing domain protein [Tuber indicum]
MESLPREILVHIAKHAPPRDINSLLQTNRTFSTLLNTTLLDSAVDRDYPDAAQRALYTLAHREDDESVLRLLRRGILDIIGKDRVLHEAIEKEPEIVVCNLWRNGAKLRTRGDQGRTPIMIAAKQGYTEAVRMMMADKDLDINEQDQWLRTALYLAAGEGNESVVEALMSHPDIDPNTTDRFGDTPLHVAVECGWSEIVALLLSSPKTLINVKDARNMAPLHIAIALEYLDVVYLLLRDPRLRANERGNSYQTALYMAASQGQTQIVRTLLRYPDVDAAGSSGPGRGGNDISDANIPDD